METCLNDMNFYAEASKYLSIYHQIYIQVTNLLVLLRQQRIQNLFVFFKNRAKTHKEIILQAEHFVTYMCIRIKLNNNMKYIKLII